MILGMADGLTVPFALAAGLSGAVDNTTVIVTAGLAEIAAGSISMGLGGYLAAKSEIEHYESEQKREYEEVKHLPEKEAHEISEIFQKYGLAHKQIQPIINKFKSDHNSWVNFMMKYELGLEKPEPNKAVKSAATIGASYIFGGFVPLLPYIIFDNPQKGLAYSIIFTFITLSVFGYIKGKLTGTQPVKSAMRTVIITGVAATAAFLLAKFISG